MFFLICTQTTWCMNITNTTSCLKESHRNRYYVYVLQGTQKHWTLSLRQNWAHLCRGFHASCRSPICSGYSWPSPSLVGMLQAWVCVFRVKGLHTGAWSFTGTWRGKEDWGKARVLGFQFVFWGVWSQMRLIPTLFYSLLHLFSDFFPQDLV